MLASLFDGNLASFELVIDTLQESVVRIYIVMLLVEVSAFVVFLLTHPDARCDLGDWLLHPGLCPAQY